MLACIAEPADSQTSFVWAIGSFTLTIRGKERILTGSLAGVVVIGALLGQPAATLLVVRRYNSALPASLAKPHPSKKFNYAVAPVPASVSSALLSQHREGSAQDVDRTVRHARGDAAVCILCGHLHKPDVRALQKRLARPVRSRPGSVWVNWAPMRNKKRVAAAAWYAASRALNSAVRPPSNHPAEVTLKMYSHDLVGPPPLTLHVVALGNKPRHICGGPFAQRRRCF